MPTLEDTPMVVVMCVLPSMQRSPALRRWSPVAAHRPNVPPVAEIRRRGWRGRWTLDTRLTKGAEDGGEVDEANGISCSTGWSVRSDRVAGLGPGAVEPQRDQVQARLP